jgi:hypothetical protein
LGIPRVRSGTLQQHSAKPVNGTRRELGNPEPPHLGDIIPALPNRLKARLSAAFDLTVLWNKTSGQATVSVEITDATLKTLTAILNPDQDGYHDTDALPADPPPMGPWDEHTRCHTADHRAESPRMRWGIMSGWTLKVAEALDDDRTRRPAIHYPLLEHEQGAEIVRSFTTG